MDLVSKLLFKFSEQKSYFFYPSNLENQNWKFVFSIFLNKIYFSFHECKKIPNF
jgi:hypothetical protein